MPHALGRLTHPLGHLEPHILNGSNYQQYGSIIESLGVITCYCYFCIGLSIKNTYLIHTSLSIKVSRVVTGLEPYRFPFRSI